MRWRTSCGDYDQPVEANPGLKLLGSLVGLLIRGLFALPDGLMKRVFGDPPPEARGLMPDAWALGRLTAISEGSDPDFALEKSRREMELMAGAASLATAGVRSERWILEGDGRNLQARLFTPPGVHGRTPLLVHFHGGGFVQGSIGTHAGACSWLALGTGVRVLSVGYRLAPEHPFPAQAEDALLAWRSVMRDPARFGADPARVGVIGDSAGAQMATVLCLDLKAAGEPQPAAQFLVYPVTDCTGSMPSRDRFATGYYLTRNRIEWFESCFVDREDAGDPRASPLFAEDLSGLAPALVSLSIADPLRDEGLAYAERMIEAGVPVTVDHMPLLHSWFNVTASRSSRKGHEVLASRVNELLG